MSRNFYIWRIATQTRSFRADDLSGEGAKQTGGRWNSEGTPVVYAAQTRALACLETLVHLADEPLPLNRFLIKITVPGDVWKSAKKFSQKTNKGWDAEPYGMISTMWGDEWLLSNSSALAFVPSVLVPEESCVLINPAHSDAKSISASIDRKWTYDSRLR